MEGETNLQNRRKVTVLLMLPTAAQLLTRLICSRRLPVWIFLLRFLSHDFITVAQCSLTALKLVNAVPPEGTMANCGPLAMLKQFLLLT